MSRTYESQVAWDDGEMLDVKFHYYEGTPPQFYGDAPNPGDSEELEIIELRYKSQPFEVSAEDKERLELEILENIADHIDEGPDEDDRSWWEDSGEANFFRRG